MGGSSGESRCPFWALMVWWQQYRDPNFAAYRLWRRMQCAAPLANRRPELLIYKCGTNRESEVCAV